MTTAAPPWEHGSDFERRSFDISPSDPPPWAGAPLWMTARAAWQALIAARGWHRIWVPSYFCHDVSLAALEAGAEIVVYLDDPLEDRIRYPSVADEPGEALLVVNTFGRRLAPEKPFSASHCELIEDHSHDPLSRWARNSRADWCLASLRKTLPVPVGGVVWSPKAHPSPSPPLASAGAERIARDRLLGMTLKQQYLEGQPVPKAEFRRHLTSTEARLVKLPPNAAPKWTSALVEQVPLTAWRELRRENFVFLAERLANHRVFRILGPADPRGAVLGAVAMFESQRTATSVETDLIRQNIYPARLWSLEGVALELPSRSVELASRLLFLHCDGRYDSSDMERVAQALCIAVENAA